MKAIVTKYHGPTDTKGSRISATAEGGCRVSIPYPHELSGEECHRLAAEALCEKFNWSGQLVGGATPDGRGYYFTFQHVASVSFPLLRHYAENCGGSVFRSALQSRNWSAIRSSEELLQLASWCEKFAAEAEAGGRPGLAAELQAERERVLQHEAEHGY